MPFQLNTIAISGSQNQNNSGAGNLYNGREASGRLDYNFSAKDRLFAQFAWNRLPDNFGFPNTEQQQRPGSRVSLIRFSSEIPTARSVLFTPLARRY